MLLLIIISLLVMVTFLVSGSSIYKNQRRNSNSPVKSFFKTLILLLPF